MDQEKIVLLLSRPRKGRKYKEWVVPFLKAYRRTGCAIRAIEAINWMITPDGVTKARKRHPYFKAAMEVLRVESRDRLLGEAWRRGVEGRDELVIFKGQPCWIWLDNQNRQVPEGTPGATPVPLTKRRYSDAILLELLHKIHPEFKEESKSSTVNVQTVVGNDDILTRITACRNALLEADKRGGGGYVSRNGHAQPVGGAEADGKPQAT